MSFKHPSGEQFEGKIGRTVYESEPWWPTPKLPQGKPNVVLVVLDDTGYSHFGCYGSTIETPNIDRLAQGGLRYTNFHTTALCSPTRACLLTGRNHHAVGMRGVSNMDTGFPNMRGYLPPSAATLADVLRDAGYGTYAAGKWHLTPMSECTAAGPFHNWPLRRGFDRFYGFMQGETDQFYPELTSDNQHIEAPALPEDGYHVSEDVVDKSIGFIRDQVSLVPERPFFAYVAFGATHSPHQAPEAYLAKYRGRFDEGWDVMRKRWFDEQKRLGIIPENTALAPLNPGVKPWSELSDNEKKFANRLQEAFAAQLDHTDAQIGRLMTFLEEIDQFDNTLFIVMSDNGASQEGGPTGVFDEMKWFNGMMEDVDAAVARLDDIGGPESHSNIPWGWSQVGNTPLKWYKQNTHGGGVRDPLVIHWPNGISAKGSIRSNFCHVIDIMPTILELTGTEAPEKFNGVEQMPVHGASLAGSLHDETGSPTRSVQFFEMLGHRGIWQDGWKAVTRHVTGTSWDTDDKWELYHLDEDFSETNDLAQVYPERLEAMVALWWEEAEKHGALPLDDRPAAQTFRAAQRPGLPTSRDRYVYYPPVSHIVSDACPSTARGWTTDVVLVHPGQGADGALVNRGTINSGFVLYIRNNRLHFDYNCFHEHTKIAATDELPPGELLIRLEVERLPERRAAAKILVNGELQAEAEIPRLLGMLSSTGMDFGRAMAPINKDYQPPFAYPGQIRRVVFQLPVRANSKDKAEEAEREARAAMARQ
ncbi:MAG: arylsulfatase [Pseudomonadales bacterium]|nr:arylsulfatase [Pseudomonadales bacterium]